MKFPFTRKQVYDILRQEKCIDADYLQQEKKSKIIPVKVRFESGSKSELKDIGLVLEIRGGKSMGMSLNFRNRKIRCINYHKRRLNPDGSIVRGWHEHIEEEGGKVIPLPQNFSDIDELVEFVLDRWQITKLGSSMGEQLFLKFKGGT